MVGIEAKLPSADNEEFKKKSDEALALANSSCSELFIDQYGKPFAVIAVNSHFETLSLQSQKFRNWIAKLYYGKKAATLSNVDLSSVLNVLKAKAQFSGVQRQLDVRVAQVNDSILYDLTNSEWQCVRIAKEGWSITPAPVMFIRYANHKPQVYPVKDYPDDILDQFMGLLNIKDEDHKLLLKCYLISLFIPNIAKPALMPYGPQGSAKSTLMELVKMVVDPSVTPTLSFPKDSTELMQKLAHNYVAYFDNVSYIPDWISDDLCKAVTGSGFSKRALYTDDDDVIYSFKRCIGFNGINLGAQKADLLDRGLIIQLERIPREKQRKLTEIWADFEVMRPKLLGSVMNTLVEVLQRKGGVNPKQQPRMADFAEYGELISRCLGNSENMFLDAYFRNIDLQTEEVLESNPVGAAIMNAVNDGAPCGDCNKCQEGKLKDCTDRQKLLAWSGTPGDLYSILTKTAIELNLLGARGWPKAPNALSRAINEVVVNLREIGITITKKKTATKRIIEIRKISSQASISSFGHEKSNVE